MPTRDIQSLCAVTCISSEPVKALMAMRLDALVPADNRVSGRHTRKLGFAVGQGDHRQRAALHLFDFRLETVLRPETSAISQEYRCKREAWRRVHALDRNLRGRLRGSASENRRRSGTRADCEPNSFEDFSTFNHCIPRLCSRLQRSTFSSKSYAIAPAKIAVPSCHSWTVWPPALRQRMTRPSSQFKKKLAMKTMATRMMIPENSAGAS